MRVKLHIVPAGHPKLRYQHEMVCLAEGFRLLGVEYAGSDDYWIEPENNRYLISKGSGSFNSDVNIYNTYYFIAFPEAISKVDYSKFNILIDREDGLYGEYCNPKYGKFNLILRTHFNRNINYNYYHPNIQPWAFGLSERILSAVDKAESAPVADRTFVSFRISHDLRSKAAERFSPAIAKKYPLLEMITAGINAGMPVALSEADKIYWEQSGHRHDPSFYKLLNSSLLTYAFGGFVHVRPFATNRLVKQLQAFYKLRSAVMTKMGMDDSGCYFIDQFDSWRLWESLYSHTCPVHMDFKDWKWILPVMPENRVHYWGVKGFDFEESARALSGLHRDDILKIGQAGREWSKKYYSPVAVAERLLKLIK